MKLSYLHLGEVCLCMLVCLCPLCSWALCLFLNHEVICTITLYHQIGYLFLFLKEWKELGKVSLVPHLVLMDGKLDASMRPLHILNQNFLSMNIRTMLVRVT